MGGTLNQGTQKVALKVYNLLRPSIFLILIIDSRASSALLVTRTYLSVDGVAL